MTLLHQAAQKAVEALTRDIMNMRGELEDDWSQAESGCYKLGHREARHEAVALVNDAIAALESALQQQPEPVAVAVWQSQCKDGTWADCTEANARAGERYGFPMRALYTAPPALQQQEVPREPVAKDVRVSDFIAGAAWHMANPDESLDALQEAAEWWATEHASPSTTRQQEAPYQSYGGSVGYKVAMCVLQSELYHHLDDDERADCDELIRSGQAAPRQQEVGSGAYAQTTGEKEYLSWFPITIGGPHA